MKILFQTIKCSGQDSLFKKVLFSGTHVAVFFLSQSLHTTVQNMLPITYDEKQKMRKLQTSLNTKSEQQKSE